MSKGNGRACIKYPSPLRTKSRGKRPAMFNSNFCVEEQNAPTAAHPVSQHKQFKGHSTNAGAHLRKGK